MQYTNVYLVMLRVFETSLVLPCYPQITGILQQVTQLSQRDRAAGWVSFGQKWKTGTGRPCFADILRLSSTTVT